MSVRASLFLALRYLKLRRSFVSISMLLSILGPIIGVAVLVVVISVMNGFHKRFEDKVFGFTSHLTVSKGGLPIRNADQLVGKLEEMGFKATPVIQGSVLVQAGRQAQPLTVVGIQTETDRRVTAIRESCLDVYRDEQGRVIRVGDDHVYPRLLQPEGKRPSDARPPAPAADDLTAQPGGAIYDGLEDHQVLVGRGLVKRLGVTVGSKLIVHPTGRLEQYVKFKEDGEIQVVEPDEQYLPEELIVAGIFSYGFPQVDNGLVIVTLDKAAELMTVSDEGDPLSLGWGDATSIKVRTDDPFKYDVYQRQIVEQPAFSEYYVTSWRNDALGFFDALQMEKTLMIVLLLLIIVAAAFCVCATLITIVLQKTREIGVLKSLGACPATVTGVFLLQGGVIGLLGTAGGILLGLLLVAVRNPFLRLVSRLMGRNVMPSALYFFDELPADVRTHELVVIGVSTYLICILAAVIPALMAMLVRPSRAIRSE